MNKRFRHLRRFLTPILVLMVALVVGCRRDMQDQPHVKPLERSAFFVDERSARPIPADTIARGHLNDQDEVHTGVVDGKFLMSMPLSVDRALLARGQERYRIYCSMCHGLLGDGNGIVAKRGFKWPANLHSDRVRQAPPGYLFQVITYGYGAMPDYATQIKVQDRWAIIAYVRALELSRHATVADVPGDRKLEERP
jgi:hypothetical protein